MRDQSFFEACEFLGIPKPLGDNKAMAEARKSREVAAELIARMDKEG